MSKYALPSGIASIDAVVGLNTEKDYSIPLSKKNIQKSLLESLYCNLEHQQQIVELKANIESLRKAAENTINCDKNNSGYIPSLCCFQQSIDELAEAIKETPKQSLLNVQVDLIEEYDQWQLDNSSMAMGPNFFAAKIRGVK